MQCLNFGRVVTFAGRADRLKKAKSRGDVPFALAYSNEVPPKKRRLPKTKPETFVDVYSVIVLSS